MMDAGDLMQGALMLIGAASPFVFTYFVIHFSGDIIELIRKAAAVGRNKRGW